MKSLVIGIGACGGKCAINLIEKEIIDQNDVVFINSTLKDMPEKYKQSTIRIGNDMQGAGQERSRGKKMALDAIKSEQLKLDGLCDPDHEKVIIITSLSGGTGSGASVVIAKYMKDVVGIPVEIYGVVGFHDESVRALRNITEFCQDLEGDYIIQLIRNDAFLKKANGNRLSAEKMANDEIARRIIIGSGSLIKESTQNIDDVDLLKLETTPGYKTVEYILVDERIKSQDQFNSIIKEGLDNTASVESDAGGMKRLGVVLNLSRSSQEFVDYSYAPIRSRLGIPYEVFNHVENIDGHAEFIAIIATGMKMPLEEITRIYEQYQKQVQEVDTNNDDFFEKVNEMKGDISDNLFDMKDRKPANGGSKADFLAAFEEKEEPKTEVKRTPKMSREDLLSTF